ncbi:hypothetical protein F5884DRAFT_26221 [Xylogone sp. PMI_703]|nr:hypothetical protein F5884DRAFT_26221 [Xylogone sp. PMI_703]
MRSGSVHNARLLADFIWLYFMPGALDSDSIKQSFFDLRLEFQQRDGCRHVVWGQDTKESQGCAVIIVWRDAGAQISNNQFVHEATEKFMRETNSLTKEPQFFHFNTRKNAFSFGRQFESKFPLLELTTFEIPTHPQSQFLLNKFYHQFQSTIGDSGSLFIGMTPVAPLAAKAGSWFFHNQPFHSSNNNTSATEIVGMKNNEKQIYLTTLISWRSVEAMQEWYSDFARCQIYGRLGYKTDALRCYS